MSNRVLQVNPNPNPSPQSAPVLTRIGSAPLGRWGMVLKKNLKLGIKESSNGP